MREVDRRSKYDRRVFLKGAATAVPTVAIATSAGLTVSDAWADDATTLTPATLKTLVKVARDIYPHDFLGDSYYITAIKPWDGKAAKDPATKALINDGAKLVVLGPKEKLSDLPEFKNETISNVDLTARFMDYAQDKKLMVVAQENVLGNPNDGGVDSSEVIREFAKALCQVCGTRPVDPNWDSRGRDVQQYELRVKRLDVQFDEKLKQLYDAAMTNKKWRGTPAVRDRVEYFAVGALAYFDSTGQQFAPNDATHQIATREMLKEYDPDLYALVNETFAYDGHPDWRYVHN